MKSSDAISIISIFFIVYALIIHVFPPKFKNGTFGLFTKMTSKNEKNWKQGQRYFALYCYLMGVLCGSISFINIHNDYKYFGLFFLLIFSYKVMKGLIDKKLEINNQNE